MWEMQALTSSTSMHNANSDQVSPNHIIEGGITDMDTSNDEKSDNELSGMDCITPDKVEKVRRTSNPGAANSTDTLKIPSTNTPSSMIRDNET